MTDPAVAYLPGEGYGPYDRGAEQDIWLKNQNGSQSLGLVWPGKCLSPRVYDIRAHNIAYTGVTVYPGMSFWHLDLVISTILITLLSEKTGSIQKYKSTPKKPFKILLPYLKSEFQLLDKRIFQILRPEQWPRYRRSLDRYVRCSASHIL